MEYRGSTPRRPLRHNPGTARYKTGIQRMSDSEHLPETKDSYESSVQKVESDLETKNINAVDENNPLARGLNQ